MSKFGAVLHAHTEFSTRDSLIRAEELPTLAAEAGWGACAITDHGGIEGAFTFMKAAKKAGIKPIIGVELYVSAEGSDKAHHLTILAKNARGFSSLSKVLTIAHATGWDAKRQRAVATLPVVLNNLRDCVVTSGCYSSPLFRDGTEETVKDIERFADVFGDDFFFEVQPLFDWNEQIVRNAWVLATARKFNRQIIVTPDCHFGRQEDGRFHEGLLAVGSHYPVGHAKAWTFSTKLNYMMGPEEIAANLQAAGFSEDDAIDALANTAEAADRIEEWDWSDLPAPRLPEVEGDLSVLAHDNLKSRGLASSGTYENRLNEELNVFEPAGLGPYLLLVRECVQLFREKGAFLGPRGSVGGSLVAYCLGLTELDPIKHGLPWQRFWAPGRKNMPDVDVDLDTAFRQEVPAVLKARFGEDKVAQISTYSTFGCLSAVRDAAKAYGIMIRGNRDFWTWKEPQSFDKLPQDEKLAVLEESPPFRMLKEEDPDAAELSRVLLGRVRQFGAHAGGFVVTADPLAETRGPIVNRGKAGKALAWDMEAAEALGYVKLDFLGNSTLSALRTIDEDLGGIDWAAVPLDDETVIKDFAEGRTAGVPQFLTPGLRVFVEALGPTKFEDLVWATAAHRPGALGTMSATDLITRYRRDPGSVIVYQEDLMQLCVGLAGFSWKEADGVRKAVGKKLPAELARIGEDFVRRSVANGVFRQEEAEQFWTMLAGFGAYAFNLAHSASYTWNSYRVAWAKRAHPPETFAGLLNAQLEKPKDKDGSEFLVDEAPEFGVEIRPGNVNRSGLKWRTEGSGVRAPLMRIPGADLRIAKGILRRRDNDGPFKDEPDLRKRMGKTKVPDDVYAAAFDEECGTRFHGEVSDPSKEIEKGFAKKVIACQECELRATCRAPVPPELNATNVLVVGEAPGAVEDRRGRPFLGKSGQLLFGVLEKFGIDRGDVSITNAVHCLSGDSRVRMPDGETRPIRDLVRSRYSGFVMSVNPSSGELVPAQVIGWHKSDLAGRKLLRVTPVHGKSGRQGDAGITVTAEHEFLTHRGYVRADELFESDLVATGDSAPGPRASSVVLGTMLGDATIPKGRAALEFSHCLAQSEWFQLKSRVLSTVGVGRTREQEVTLNGKKFRRLHATMRPSIFWRNLRERFYPEKNKVVPRDLIEQQFDDQLLATWFIDDGYVQNRPPRRPQASIATNCFSKSDVEFLCEMLQEEGLDAHPRKGSGWRVAFRAKGSEALIDRIARFVPDSMARTKKPGSSVRLDPYEYRPDVPWTFWDRVRVKPDNSVLRAGNPVYCLDVRGTHNFATLGGVVHNCKPPYREDGTEYDDSCHWLAEEIGQLGSPLVLAVGRRAWHKLGGSGGIRKANATVKEGHPLVVACVHPAGVLRDVSQLPELERACRKFARLFKELTGKKETANVR